MRRRRGGCFRKQESRSFCEQKEPKKLFDNLLPLAYIPRRRVHANGNRVLTFFASFRSQTEDSIISPCPSISAAPILPQRSQRKPPCAKSCLPRPAHSLSSRARPRPASQGWSCLLRNRRSMAKFSPAVASSSGCAAKLMARLIPRRPAMSSSRTLRWRRRTRAAWSNMSATLIFSARPTRRAAIMCCCSTSPIAATRARSDFLMPM